MPHQRQLETRQALLRLQALLNDPVSVEMNDYGSFFGCAFRGTLDQVEILPGSDTAITVFLSDGAGFFLDFEIVDTFLVRQGGGPPRLEFRRRDGGPTIEIHWLASRTP
ncbi:MAG TPA: hypothetical protein VFN18_05490 [Solirubrobacterales bacterium]|nr:hypothetical protein [Solirubrobacterales bacterium]